MKKGSIPVEQGESEREGKAWGHGEFANMPQEVHMQEMKENMYAMKEELDDTSRRLDEDAKQETKGFRKNLDRGMY